MKKSTENPNEDRGLSNWVINSLRAKILEGHFAPGEKLDQDSIALEFKVSRTPVREALKILDSEGFVEVQPYHGVYIPRFSKQDIHDVYEVRSIIEYEVVRQAAPLIPDDVISYMEGLLTQEADVVKDADTTPKEIDLQHYASDREFHSTIASYCKNKLFLDMLEHLNNRILRVRSWAQHQPGAHIQLSHQEHIEILKAIRSRDAIKAAQLMQEHLIHSAERIEVFLTE
jgi:DNA-binding GntR family transcriptional regulator